ncbi:hypothetical protein SAMN04515674_115102 [Pseudarcicella hirudinis]|uniref:Uncharacterized protein n=1 Tax=Pseudarcicella hirudinis TaxID=1079859 RepID=A0A1I5XPP0_9BACT|nr:YeeE/YedE thiosulfate transporter family protein [Pseudarcicella hirudinis]SFQ33919.1 hypothetical protein SAMN04515674_115102 [Pseudarcicella hirudinis]
MLELIRHPWHWSVAGFLIGLTVPALLILGNKTFGISSNLRHICAMCVPANIPFFKYDWKKEAWNLFFIAGVVLGGFIANHFLSNPDAMVIAEKTKEQLASEGITQFSNLLPTDLFSFESLFSLRGFIFIVVGGFLVGFGTRWAGGCTSGHAIMGLSNLQLPSLVATICFMVGGILMTWLGIPFLLSL